MSALEGQLSPGVILTSVIVPGDELPSSSSPISQPIFHERIGQLDELVAAAIASVMQGKRKAFG